MKVNEYEFKGCGHPKFYQILKELAILHDLKNVDYATPENPLGNFYRVAELCKRYKLLTPGFEATKVALIYSLKQEDALLKLLSEGETGQVEGVPERLNDKAVYSVIARILYEEESNALK